LTRALLSLPPSKLRRLIVLEKNDKYLPCLHVGDMFQSQLSTQANPTRNQELAKVDDRLVVVPQSPYEWDTYVEIERLGLLSHIPTATWDQGPSASSVTCVYWLLTTENSAPKLTFCLSATTLCLLRKTHLTTHPSNCSTKLAIPVRTRADAYLMCPMDLHCNFLPSFLASYRSLPNFTRD
jgi:hypothetical protein